MASGLQFHHDLHEGPSINNKGSLDLHVCSLGYIVRTHHFVNIYFLFFWTLKKIKCVRIQFKQYVGIVKLF
jgi:hypothetical protein